VVWLEPPVVLVRPKPVREHSGHADFVGAADVLEAAVTHEERALGLDPKRIEGRHEDRGMRLALADLRREDGDVEPLAQPHALEVSVQKPPGIEGVRDEAGPEPALAERVEESMRGISEPARRFPGSVLSFEEAGELVVGHVDAEALEQLAHHPRVLDLVERAGHPEQRQVALAETRGRLFVARDVIAAKRGEACVPARLDERLVPGEVEERVAPVEEHRIDQVDPNVRVRPVLRKTLYALLAVGPLVVVLDRAGASDMVLFTVAAAALIPLAWLIGEATEHAAQHTGPGIGGFLNATFGNAPELIIALFAVSDGLTEVVRGSLSGSVVGNLLLVLGFSLVFGGRGEIDRESSLTSIALVLAAVLLFLIPAVPSWTGDPDRHSLAVVSLPVSIVLLLIYVVTTWYSLRRHRLLHVAGEREDMNAWSLPVALGVLAAATVVTAFVAEILVHSLETFADKAHLSDFFVAAVIVAIVGNAAEHGGAVVVAYRGRIKLAAEIALASSAQVAVFLIPAVALLAWAIEPLALSFRPVELLALAGSAAFAAVLLWNGRSSRARGFALVAAYVGVALAFFLVGDRNP
jgi:Ca2+:H+ antiporter